MYRLVLIKFERNIPVSRSSIQRLNVLTYKFSKNFATCILQLLEDHRIPTNTNVNERLWTGRFGANRTGLRFTWRNRFLYLGRTVKLWTYWMYFTIKFFSVSFVIDEKKLLWWKVFAFLNSFLNILNKYADLILNK